MNKHFVRNTLLTISCCCAASGVIAGPGINSESQAPNTLTPVEGAMDDRFGQAVAIDGSWALVGAPSDDENGPESGAAYLYKRTNGQWLEVQKIIAADGETGDSFGHAVSLSGHTAVIGAVFDDDLGLDAGAAYVFSFDGIEWQQTDKLTADLGDSLDFFGVAISQSDERILIGANHHDAVANSGGSAFVFEQHEGVWNQTARLNASDTGAGDQFGFALSLSGDQALIGAHRHQLTGAETGAAYVFELKEGEWLESAKLSDPAGQHGDRFGIAVSLNDGQALIGASGQQQRQGGALLFESDAVSWLLSARLMAHDGAAFDGFGLAVSLRDQVALVGAPYAQPGDTGAVYQFRQRAGDWPLNKKHTPAHSGEYLFGISLGQSAEHFLVGATGMDASLTGSGAVYLHNMPLRLSMHR